MVSIVWILSGQLIESYWLGVHWTRYRVWDQTNAKNLQNIPFDELRWYLGDTLILRSWLCMLISTVKNIYDSFRVDQIVPIPPSEYQIQDLEQILHIPIAFDYFHEFLYDGADDDILMYNYSRWLALYTDIRCFQDELYKNKATEDKMQPHGQSMHPSPSSKVSSRDSRVVSARSSFTSNISLDSSRNYLQEATIIALQIFDEYLRKNAVNYTNIDQ